MKPTKKLLFERYGNRCMLCGKEYPKKYLEWHHLVPRYVYKSKHKPPDDSIENSALVCANCHIMIHEFRYEDEQYQIYTSIILQNKASF